MLIYLCINDTRKLTGPMSRAKHQTNKSKNKYLWKNDKISHVKTLA